MSDLYPFLLRPEFVERPWGARDLAPIYPDHRCEKPVGEVWLTGDENRLPTGRSPDERWANFAANTDALWWASRRARPSAFPLLIKFLFPREKLSVQVHPDDEAARRAGQPCGKTECWYVLAADPGAQVALGLKPGVTREQLAQAIREVRAEELLNWVDIHAGEMIYVDAGTVHTIGPGSILVETQQNSDTTYRLYDYGRPREIHVEQGLAAMKERTRAGKVQRQNGGDVCWWHRRASWSRSSRLRRRAASRPHTRRRFSSRSRARASRIEGSFARQLGSRASAGGSGRCHAGAHPRPMRNLKCCG